MKSLVRTSIVAAFIVICLSVILASPAQSQTFDDGETHDVYDAHSTIHVYDGPEAPTTVNLHSGTFNDDPKIDVRNNSILNIYNIWAMGYPAVAFDSTIPGLGLWMVPITAWLFRRHSVQ